MRENYYLEENKERSFLSKYRNKFCLPIRDFLYKVMQFCEDSKIKEDVKTAIQTMEDNTFKMRYLDSKKDEIRDFIDSLKNQIIFLERELEYYRAKENMLPDNISILQEYQAMMFELEAMIQSGNIEQVIQHILIQRSKGL